MKNISIDKLTDSEILKKFGKETGSLLIQMRNNVTNKLTEKYEAEIAEQNEIIRKLFDAIDQKNFKLIKQLLERFNPTKKPDKEDIDEEYSEVTTSTIKETKKRGRKAGTQNGARFDFSKIQLICKTIGMPDGQSKPREFFKLEIIPATYKLIKYTQYGDADEEMPDQFGESFLTPSLGGFLASRKFYYGLPLYRIEKILGEQGAYISRVQLANYCLRIGEELKPIRDLMVSKLLEAKTKVIHADETSLRVIKNGEEDRTMCKMFVYSSTRWEEHLISIYDFQVDRSADKIANFFGDFTGTVICDDYPGYDSFRKNSEDRISLARCWFHFKKRLDEIVLLIEKSVKEECKNLKDGQKEKDLIEARKSKSLAYKFSQEIEYLFKIEADNINLTSSELLKLRQEKSKPLVEKLFVELKEAVKKAGDPLKEAINYGLKIENDLKAFLDNPYIEMSNNRCERAVKDFVIPRKNFLFSYSIDGAKACGYLMTIVRTARLSGLDPERYITYVLEKITQVPQKEIESLLPWSKDLPEELKSNMKELPKDIQK